MAVAQTDIKKVLAYSTVSPAGLHVPGRGGRGLRGRHLPHGHPRLLQGPAVPGLGLGHPRHARRAGHAPHGRPLQVHAGHRASPSSSAGWPSPACPPSAASGRRTRSCSTPGTPTSIGGKGLWAVGLVTALLTAFYMSRQVILTFLGAPGSSTPPGPRSPRPGRTRIDAVPPGDDGGRGGPGQGGRGRAARPRTALAKRTEALDGARTEVRQANAAVATSNPADDGHDKLVKALDKAVKAVPKAEDGPGQGGRRRLPPPRPRWPPPPRRSTPPWPASTSSRPAARPVPPLVVTARTPAPDISEVEDFLPESYEHRQHYHPHESPWPP